MAKQRNMGGGSFERPTQKTSYIIKRLWKKSLAI